MTLVTNLQSKLRNPGLVASKAQQIIAQYKGDYYTAYHSQRYAVLLNLLKNYISQEDTKVLDIGGSKLTKLIRSEFNVKVDTIGFPEDNLTNTHKHYRFDLNDAQYQDKWRTNIPEYNVIVMAEVIEHLHTSPTLVLSFLKTLLKPEGVLIIQTPNALALWNRIKPILGIHPYELIKEDCTKADHFREYTEKELRAYAAKVDFTVLECLLGNYFDYRYLSHSGNNTPIYMGSLANIVYRYLPKTLKPGITIVLKKN